MRAVTLHAFGVTVYSNNDNMKKNAMKKNNKLTDRERIDLFSLFYHFCCSELRVSVNVIKPSPTRGKLCS